MQELYRNKRLKILVCKLRHHGDVLLTSPFLSALKEAFPQAIVDFYIPKETYPMLEGNPHLNRVYYKEDRFRALYEIYKTKYDLAFNLTEGDRGAIACFLSRAKVKVGIDPGKSGFLFKRKIYTHLVEHCPNPKHTVEKNLDALRVLGISPSEHSREIMFPIDKQIREKMRQKIGQGYILFHPVSRWLFKSLPPIINAEIMNTLVQEGYRVILSSGPGKEELKYIDAMEEYLIQPIESVAGKTTLKELGALIENAKLLVCPDSVPFHIANALKKPVVSYFGPTSEKNWGPWRNPNATIITQKYPCRPCFRAGCANTQISDCLITLKADMILGAIYNKLNVDYKVKSSPK